MVAFTTLINGFVRREALDCYRLEPRYWINNPQEGRHVKGADLRSDKKIMVVH